MTVCLLVYILLTKFGKIFIFPGKHEEVFFFFLIPLSPPNMIMFVVCVCVKRATVRTAHASVMI